MHVLYPSRLSTLVLCSSLPFVFIRDLYSSLPFGLSIMYYWTLFNPLHLPYSIRVSTQRQEGMRERKKSTDKDESEMRGSDAPIEAIEQGCVVQTRSMNERNACSEV